MPERALCDNPAMSNVRLRVARPSAVIAAVTLIATAACSDGSGGSDDAERPADEGGSGTTTETTVEDTVEVQEFVTRPDLHPPVIDVEVAGETSPGLLFLAPKQAGQPAECLEVYGSGRLGPQEEEEEIHRVAVKSVEVNGRVGHTYGDDEAIHKRRLRVWNGDSVADAGAEDRLALTHSLCDGVAS